MLLIPKVSILLEQTKIQSPKTGHSDVNPIRKTQNKMVEKDGENTIEGSTFHINTANKSSAMTKPVKSEHKRKKWLLLDK